MGLIQKANKLGYKHYTEFTVEELDNLSLGNSNKQIEYYFIQKWLREVHGIDITIYRSFSFTHSYHYCIIKDCDYDNELHQMSESNRSYEVCLEDALLEGLKMIKKK